MFDLLSQPSFFLSAFSSFLPEDLWAPRHCLASACTWELCSAHGPESRARVRKLPLRVVPGAGKLPAREGNQPALQPSPPRALSHPGLAGPLAVPALPAQTRQLRLGESGVCRRSWCWMVRSYSSASRCLLSHSLSPGGLVVECGHSHASFQDTLDFFFSSRKSCHSVRDDIYNKENVGIEI